MPDRIKILSCKKAADLHCISDDIPPKSVVPLPPGHCDIARPAPVRYCAATYERDLLCVYCQQTLDARYQGSRPLALARLTISLPASPDPQLLCLLKSRFDRLA
jgi:hypothetical protein